MALVRGQCSIFSGHGEVAADRHLCIQGQENLYQ